VAEVRMPKLGESVTEGTMGRWLKQVGDSVSKYEPLAEVITDKVSAEIPSEFVGVLTEILVREDETVKVGTPIAIITEAGLSAAPMSTNSDSAAVVNEPPQRELPTAISAGHFSPAVLRIAQERNIDLALVIGSGLGGRVTRKDVLGWQSPERKADASAGSVVATLPTTLTTETGQPSESLAPNESHATVSDDTRVTADSSSALGERIPLTAIRKTIARRMVESKRQAPHAWMMVEVDATSLVRLREQQKASFKLKEGIDLTFLPFFIKAAVEALKEFPLVNSQWAEDHILVRKSVNISIAVATEDALAVPVIQQADRLSILGLATAIQDLARRARAGKLTLADVQDGTFTVNNTGAFGSILSQPIINAPQAAILSVEAIVKRPVVQADDSIAVRSMVNLCMSLDHRILDGWVAGQFMRTVKRKIEGYNEQTPLY